MNAAEMIKPAGLILDFELYPRHSIDAVNCRRIREALAAGVELPPVIACARTRKVTDGFHRVTEYLRADPDEPIAVVLREYADDGAAFVDAARMNAQHGKALSPFDMARCAIIAERLLISEDAMATALSLTRAKYESTIWRKTATNSSGQRTLVRNGMVHVATSGSPISRAQEIAAKVVDGMRPTYHVNQLVALIEGDSMPETVTFHERLAYLRDLLNKTEIRQPETAA